MVMMRKTRAKGERKRKGKVKRETSSGNTKPSQVAFSRFREQLAKLS